MTALFSKQPVSSQLAIGVIEWEPRRGIYISDVVLVRVSNYERKHKQRKQHVKYHLCSNFYDPFQRIIHFLIRMRSGYIGSLRTQYVRLLTGACALMPAGYTRRRGGKTCMSSCFIGRRCHRSSWQPSRTSVPPYN